MTNIDPSSDPRIPYVIVNPATLQPETLANLAREFVLREQGNDIDSSDLLAAVARARTLIEKGRLLITFDPETESVGVIDCADPALLRHVH